MSATPDDRVPTNPASPSEAAENTRDFIFSTQDDAERASPPTLDAPPVPSQDNWPTITPSDVDRILPAFNPVAPILPCRFGNYLLEEKLAAGGMGVVYRARQLLNPTNPSVTRTVALKMILPEKLGSPQAVKRFLAEAANAARLEQHPNIVPVYDVGEVDGQPYFSMQIVRGGTLQQIIDEHFVLPAKTVARLIKQVADAVHFAHREAGLIHRDIKPSNILLGRDVGSSPELDLDGDDALLVSFNRCVAKLSDFGLARNSGSALTMQGEIMGTPSYMAPEQAEGDLKHIDARTDVYSLGAVLYALLTGKAPFESPEARAIIHQVIHADVVPPRQTEGGKTAPVELETICLKCLEKDPARRYATASELSDDIQRFLRDEPIKARPSGWFDRAWRRVRQNRRESLLALLAVSALAVLCAWFVGEQLDKRRDRKAMASAVTFFQADLQPALKSDRNGRRKWAGELTKALNRLSNPGRAGPVTPEALTACAGLAQRLWDAGLKTEAMETCKTLLLVSAKPPAELTSEERGEWDVARCNAALLQGRHSTELRSFDAAEDDFELARDGMAKRAADTTSDRRAVYQSKEAEAWHLLGEMYNSIPDRKRAVDAYTHSIKLRQALVAGRNDRDELDRRLWTELARGHGYLGDTLRDLGQFDEAATEYGKAEEIRRKLVRGPEDHWQRHYLARSYANSGGLEQRRGRLDRAIVEYLRAHEEQRDLVERWGDVGEYVEDLTRTALELAEMHLDQGDRGERTLGYLDLAERLCRRWLEDKHSTMLTRYLAQARLNRAACLVTSDPARALEELDEAEKTFDRLMDRRGQQSEVADPMDLYHKAVVGALRAEAGQPDNILKSLVDLIKAIDRRYPHAERMERDQRLKSVRDQQPKDLTAQVERCRAVRKGIQPK